MATERTAHGRIVKVDGPVITEDMYLDWVNNFLTVACWAEHYGLDPVEARVALDRYINQHPI